jgi:hypothetical protein
MNKNMLPYYASRAIISIGFGGLFLVTGSPVWEAILTAGVLLALFLWAPHSGRYAVHPELGVTTLRRDEWTQAVNDKAARNAFVVIMLLIGAASLYFGTIGMASISSGFLRILLIVGTLVYFGSDFWLRRAQQ